MVATFKLNCQRTGCSAHYLNKQLEHAFNKEEVNKLPVACNVIQDLFDHVKKLVAHMRKSHKQTKLSKCVQTYSETRFNGAYHMLQVFLEIFDKLAIVLDSTHLNQYLLLDKDLLEQICSFLKVFDEVIEQLSDDKKPTIYKVLPLRQRLLNGCQKFNLTTTEGVHYMSTFLHPSLKQFQIAPHEKQKAIDLVKAEILNRQSSRTSEPTIINNDSPATKLSTTTQSQQLTATRKAQNILAQCFDLPNEDEDSLVVSSPDKELTEYIDSNDVLDLNYDVLMYWKKHQNAFPILSSIVATLYSIPASNTTVERLFSLVGNTISDRRTNLKPEKELDHQRQQLVNVQEKRKLAQSSTLSSSNNVCNHDEQGPLSSSCSSSSSTTKKVRTFNDDIFSDEEIINKHNHRYDQDLFDPSIWQKYIQEEHIMLKTFQMGITNLREQHEQPSL
ncbi:unnamed protein product [Rotaria magnacalcarata]